MERGPVDFSDVVRQLVDIYQPAMAEHHHDVTTDTEEHVVVDAGVTLLNRVVSNLLENELTHLPAGCQVKGRLYSHEGSAVLVVEDNGPGFPADIGTQVFKRFVKGKHSPGPRPRTGIRRGSCPGARRLCAGLATSARWRRHNCIAPSERAPSGIGATLLTAFENPQF
jgi:signal transduction histidine kinase